MKTLNTTFPIPENWMENIHNLAELKIVLYLLRHCWNGKYFTPTIMTIDELMRGRKAGDGTRMDRGTGLSKPSVLAGIQAAMEHGYVLCEKTPTGHFNCYKIAFTPIDVIGGQAE
jgi:hypothetical protein